jgi:hypothetical protein
MPRTNRGIGEYAVDDAHVLAGRKLRFFERTKPPPSSRLVAANTAGGTGAGSSPLQTRRDTPLVE